jgi:methylisocitrate lyase
MAERYREALGAPGVIELPGCYDVLSAMLLERAGFDCVFLSGYGVAASHCGNPDIGLTTLSETATLARHVASVVGIPVVVDADDGYGGEHNVARVIGELEMAGAAGVIIEDQALPKRCGHVPGKQVLPLDRYLPKLEWALRARETPLVVVARTDAPDLDEAIRRARLYHETGADVTLIDGLQSVADVERVGAEVPGPKQINLIYGGRTPVLSAPAFGSCGFKVVLYSTPALFVAARAVYEQMQVLHASRDLNAIASQSASLPEIQSFLEGRYAERTRATPRPTAPRS